MRIGSPGLSSGRGHLDCTHLETAVVMVVGLSPVSHSHSRNSKQTTCLWRDTGGKGKLPTQHTSFNTLDNWAINPPPNQKGKGPERKGYRVMARNMYTIHSVTLRYSMSVIIILNQYHSEASGLTKICHAGGGFRKNNNTKMTIALATRADTSHSD